MLYRRLLALLLWAGAAFFLFEAVLHFFGLPILEHDKIFLPTHDRYIAIYAFTYAALLLLTSLNPRKYRALFIITMVGILVSMLNAYWISRTGGYTTRFQVTNLDRDLPRLGFATLAWYALTLFAYLKSSWSE